MPRIRTIKPEFWTDEKIVELSPWARLLFIGLWNFADDNGVIELKPKQIKMRIFPADKIHIEPLLQELAELQLIILYEVGNEKFLMCPNLSKHQIIDKPRKSNLPLPNNEINGNQLKSTEIMLGREEEGKGKGIGKEGKGTAPVGASASTKIKMVSLPDDFDIDDELIIYAKNNGIENLKTHLESFKLKAIAKNYKYAGMHGWKCAFKTALRENWAKLGQGNGSGGLPAPENTNCINHPSKPGAATISGRWYCRQCLDKINAPPEKFDLTVKDLTRKMTL